MTTKEFLNDIKISADLDVTGTLTSGSLSVSGITTAGQLTLESSQAAADAIHINASNASGGIDIDAGTNGVDINSATSLGSTTPATFSAAGLLDINNATTSTTTTSGALQVAGGAGIVENLYVGGTLNSAGATNISGNLTVGLTSDTGKRAVIIQRDNSTSIHPIIGGMELEDANDSNGGVINFGLHTGREIPNANGQDGGFFRVDTRGGAGTNLLFQWYKRISGTDTRLLDIAFNGDVSIATNLAVTGDLDLGGNTPSLRWAISGNQTFTFVASPGTVIASWQVSPDYTNGTINGTSAWLTESGGVFTVVETGTYEINCNINCFMSGSASANGYQEVILNVEGSPAADGRLHLPNVVSVGGSLKVHYIGAFIAGDEFTFSQLKSQSAQDIRIDGTTWRSFFTMKKI